MGLEVRRLKEQLSVKADVVWSLENRKQQLILRYVCMYIRAQCDALPSSSFFSLHLLLFLNLIFHLFPFFLSYFESPS